MRKQFVVLAALLCLFVAAGEMQGLPEGPATTTVYVSGPTTHTIYETTWGEACLAGALAEDPIYTGGSQFRPTGIEFGSDGLIYFADNSHSEIGRLSLDGQQFEIISDSSISTLENPTDIIFTATDAIVSSRAGSKKSNAGLYIIRNIAGLPIGDPTIPLPELLSGFGSGGGSSAESFAVLFNRDLVGTEASDDEVLQFQFNTPASPYTEFTSILATSGVPLGIAGTGVGDQEKIYVGFPKTGEIVKYDRGVLGGNPVQFAVLPDRYKPRLIETDLAGNVYVAASRRDNGADGALFCIPPGGGVTHRIDLASAYGVAVGAGASVTADNVNFPATGGNGYKLCGDEITLEVPGGIPITVSLTCQDITPADFEAELDPAVFPLVSGNQPVKCIPEPGKKSCTLIAVHGLNDQGLVTNFIRTMVPFVDFTLASTDVGILYRPTDDASGEPDGLFDENILRQLEIVNWGFDPGRLTGSRDNFGSEVVFCTGCNTAPDVDAGADFSVEYGREVDLSGTVDDFALIIDSFDPESPTFGDEHNLLTVNWVLTSEPSAGDSFTTTFDPDTGVAIATVTGLPSGAYVFRLDAIDAEGLTDDDTVTVTVEDPPDITAPTISAVAADPKVMWPPNHDFWPITVTVTASDDFDDAPVCRVVTVTHSEAINGNGDGDTDPDWDFTSTLANQFQEGPLTVLMRAERTEAGSGRYYSVSVECQDSTGNTSPVHLEADIVRVKDNSGSGN